MLVAVEDGAEGAEAESEGFSGTKYSGERGLESVRTKLLNFAVLTCKLEEMEVTGLFGKNLEEILQESSILEDVKQKKTLVVA